MTDLNELTPLTIDDITEWLNDNRKDYEAIKARPFPPINDEFYSTYETMENFMGYYPYRSICDVALHELKAVEQKAFHHLIAWTKKYETLGAKDMLMFAVYYDCWKEDVDKNKIKIHEGLYTHRKPFLNMLCFWNVFAVLYWEYKIHENEFSEQYREGIRSEVIDLLSTDYIDTSPE